MNTFALVKTLKLNAMDRILLYLAFNAMRKGYRHGAFLDAAATAAKCVIYQTYVEQNKNLRVTGQLHHIEPKRVKEIVQEMEQALTKGKLLKMLGSQEPRYLIQFPYIWLERYPYEPGTVRILGHNLSEQERQQITENLPPSLPDAQLINQFQLRELIEQLYNRTQEESPSDRQGPLSEAMAEHVERRLLHSGTVLKIETTRGIPIYALARTSYSPVGTEARTRTMLEDTAHYFHLLQRWVDQDPQCMRVIEELDIDPSEYSQAMADLDMTIRNWADRYHRSSGIPVTLQMAYGPNEALTQK